MKVPGPSRAERQQRGEGARSSEVVNHVCTPYVVASQLTVTAESRESKLCSGT